MSHPTLLDPKETAKVVFKKTTETEIDSTAEWLRRLAREKKIRYKRIGRSIFFDPADFETDPIVKEGDREVNW